MKIVGANGIKTHGAGNIDLVLLKMRQRGFETLDVTLPYRHWFSARWGGWQDGYTIAKQSANDDIIVAHSFGCERAWHAHQVRDYQAIVCIAPAMEEGAEWRYPERVYCFYSPDDWAVRIGSWLRFHPFGRAGNKGFSQAGVTNQRLQGLGHNDFFYGQHLQRICDHIALLAN